VPRGFGVGRGVIKFGGVRQAPPVIGNRLATVLVSSSGNNIKGNMKPRSTVFLQAVIVLIGIVTLAIMIRFPLTEGRAENLDCSAYTLTRSSYMDMRHQSLFLLRCIKHSNYSVTSDKTKYSRSTR
jgi:hypothetical protein